MRTELPTKTRTEVCTDMLTHTHMCARLTLLEKKLLFFTDLSLAHF